MVATDREFNVMNLEKTIHSLKQKLYSVKCFDTQEEAAVYLDTQIDGKVVGFGDSKTMIDMRLYDRLSKHNTVYDPNQGVDYSGLLALAKKCLKYDLPTPCVVHYKKTGALKCFDCSHPERICNCMVTYLRKMEDVEDVEVILINEELGF